MLGEPEQGNSLRPASPERTPWPSQRAPPSGQAPPSETATVTRVWAPLSTRRMTTDGFLQSAGRLGAIIGPLIRMTCQALPLLPPILYGTAPIVASLIILLFLPETQGLPLPDTIEDLKNQ